jgi:hypothetical protein
MKKLTANAPAFTLSLLPAADLSIVEGGADAVVTEPKYEALLATPEKKTEEGADV